MSFDCGLEMGIVFVSSQTNNGFANGSFTAKSNVSFIIGPHSLVLQFAFGIDRKQMDSAIICCHLFIVDSLCFFFQSQSIGNYAGFAFSLSVEMVGRWVQTSK